VLRYAWRDLVRNPRRTLAAMVGVILGTGLFSSLLFFSDASGATLTRRAIAPLALDMQVVLDSALGRGLRLDERLLGPTNLEREGQVRLVITVENQASQPANDVVVRDEPPPPLSYVPGTLTLDGRPVPDVDGQSALAHGPARTGLNIGTVPPAGTVVLQYLASAEGPVPAVAELRVQGRISSREQVEPTPANAPPPPGLERLQNEIRSIPGVVAADGLTLVDLPPTSLRAGGHTVSDVVRVFGMAPDYPRHHPSVVVTSGSLGAGSAVLSAEAARSLGAGTGSTVVLSLPGGAAPLRLPVSGVADLGRATALFSSRRAKTFEDLVYVPHSVIVDPVTFDRRVLPAFQAAVAAPGSAVKSLPQSEVDLLVDRSRLNSEPAVALTQTTAIARSAGSIAPKQSHLIDNISNALDVARDDAEVGRAMFVFLGVPGLLLAVFLTTYAGSILAATQRREHALLRLRGADGGHLRRVLACQALVLSGIGALLGTGLGFLSVTALVGSDAVLAATPRDLMASGLVAVGVGMLATLLALVVPGALSLRGEIARQGHATAADPVPVWRRWRAMLTLLVVAAVAQGLAVSSGALDAPAGSVSEGQSVSLRPGLLVAPLLAWLGGTFLAASAVQSMAARLPVPSAASFGPLLHGNLLRSLRRRPWALATGSAGIGLVLALATALTMFSATYSATKHADSRFTVGSDVRVSPSPLSSLPHPTGSAAGLQVSGVTGVTPVVFQPGNAVLVGRFDQERVDLAAIDPSTFADTAPLVDAFFTGGSASAAMAALRSRHDALLVDEESARGLSIATGDEVQVLLARGTDQQTLESFHVVGLFERLPGFPAGTNLVANLGYYESATRLTEADFFLLRAADQSSAGLAGIEAALRSGPGGNDPMHVDTTETVLDKDQSSLTALDTRSLVELDLLFSALMSVTVVAIFVFGLMLHRRKEYLTLRALGMRARTQFALVIAEAGLVVLCGVVTGAVVGIGVGYQFIQVLRPLFIVSPVVSLPTGSVIVLALVPALAAIVSALAANAALRRMRPTEVLRESW
jgi:putative ABC transport system permease protein